MDASILLWEQWHNQVKQFFEEMHGHQKKTLALAVMSILLAGSAVLQRMAESIHLTGISSAKMPSIERRLARFVANERIVVHQVWKDFLAQVLPYWHGKRLSLILDCTPCGEKATIVYLGLLAHSRVLPLMWRVMPRPGAVGREAVAAGRAHIRSSQAASGELYLYPARRPWSQWCPTRQAVPGPGLALSLTHLQRAYRAAQNGPAQGFVDRLWHHSKQSWAAVVWTHVVLARGHH